jgi:hypothetical protein
MQVLDWTKKNRYQGLEQVTWVWGFILAANNLVRLGNVLLQNASLRENQSQKCAKVPEQMHLRQTGPLFQGIGFGRHLENINKINARIIFLSKLFFQ